jgi:TolA-binding protein
MKRQRPIGFDGRRSGATRVHVTAALPRRPRSAPGSRAPSRHWRDAAAWAPKALLLGLSIAVLLAGCAKSGDVDRIEQENRVQDARLKALEDGMGEAVRKQTDQLTQQVEALQRSLEARYSAMGDRVDQLAAEENRISGEGDITRADLKKHERRFNEYIKAQQVALQEQANDVDKLRLRVQDVDKLLKSPIADLPSATEADKAWREAYFLMISGQLDLAADRFAQFMQSYPQDKRRPEALLRQGQSYFMIRKYDFALAPLYELLDKFGTSKSAVDGRWYIARALEETGDLKLAKDFYAQLITGKTVYAADASRRVALIQKLGQDAAAPPREGSKEPGVKGDPSKGDNPGASSPAGGEKG